jgi:DNA repair exonuclease SbcCD ATPase subunit
MQIDNYDVHEQPKQSEEMKSKRSTHLSPEENRLRSRSVSRSSSIGTIHDEIQDTLHNLLNKQKELEHDQQVTNDWRTIATKIDKILFYIFLLLTIISTVGLLVVVPFSRTYTQQKTKLWHGTRRP